jgi:hypothetical protein
MAVDADPVVLDPTDAQWSRLKQWSRMKRYGVPAEVVTGGGSSAVASVHRALAEVSR